ncbi:hypothetical protein [Halomonas gemina]|nr:hypothetical protein [Halomonas gemina]
MTNSFLLMMGGALVVLAVLHWLLFRLVKRAMARSAKKVRPKD